MPRRVRALVLAPLLATVAVVLAPTGAAQAAPTWGPCPAVHGASKDTLCTTIRVPVDYARPSAGSIGVLVSKLPARGERRGVLFGNPGGPGGDAIGMFSLLQTPLALRDSYDLIAVQPRGLIGAGALDCTPPSPSDPASYLFAAGALRASCAKKSSQAYIRSITTANTARDIDSARAQLGLGDRVDLLGISYGTTLMSTYATLFPQHTDRLMLDSAVDPRLEWNTLLTAQTPGYRARISDLFTWIADHDSIYRLGSTPLAVYRTWSAKVTAEAGMPPSVSPPPARVGDVPPGLRAQAQAYVTGQNLTGEARARFDNLLASLVTGKRQSGSTLLTLTRIGAPDRNAWPLIAQRILAAPQAPPKQSPDDLRVGLNSVAMQNTLLCNENAVPANLGLVPASLVDQLLVSDPVAGPGLLFESGLFCSGVTPSARPVPITGARLQVRPLQIQAIGDPQTPYRPSLEHRRLMGAHLITVGGGDHGQFGRSNPVVDAAIVDYLRTGRTSVTTAPQAPITTSLR
ncbi:alpha/beta fold hydrolase [uncultured Williamsia sp.]|uniref:alpha/beta fold hydrolase n=1 Tax=uncultured Williamsia sp. TaxID=259311 RepID=UPI0026381DF1|nr:alpha/beta fold hydrolase [uncultured Williamsia sp.]